MGKNAKKKAARKERKGEGEKEEERVREGGENIIDTTPYFSLSPTHNVVKESLRGVHIAHYDSHWILGTEKLADGLLLLLLSSLLSFSLSFSFIFCHSSLPEEGEGLPDICYDEKERTLSVVNTTQSK